MPECILIVEDDPSIAALGKQYLERAGFTVHVAATGAAGLAVVAALKPTIVLLDVELPDMSGLDVCKSIADATDAFILMVSAHSSEGHVLTALERGADDYITKPFSFRELAARIHSFIRRRERSRSNADRGGELTLGSTKLVRESQSLFNGPRRAMLTMFEFRLLWFMGESVGKLLTRTNILERVWNDVTGKPTRVVDVHVASLRPKLAYVAPELQIGSVRGIGYRLDFRPVKAPSTTRFEAGASPASATAGSPSDRRSLAGN